MDSILSIISEVTPIHVTETGEQVVYGRELHKGLEINQNYESWFEEMCEYGIKKDKHYFEILTNSEEGSHPQKDHIITLRGVKHILYVQDSELGCKIRDELIDLSESQFNQEKDSEGTFRDYVHSHLEEIITEARKLQTKEKGE